MWRPDPELLAQRLSEHFGIALEGRMVSGNGGYPALELLPSDCRPSEAFRITIETSWRSLEMQFVPGSFAGELITQMGNPAQGRAQMFVRMADDCAAGKGRLVMRVNGDVVPAVDPATWPGEWRQLEIVLAKSPASVNTDDLVANDAELLHWARKFTGLVFSLLPMEEEEGLAVPDGEGLPEGATVRITVNRYERNRINRAACIELHGTSCKACNFSFQAAYGPVGSGFIHVHHVTPVSRIGAGYVIDPLLDLIPLCPNCHAMAHRRDPPYRVEQIRQMLLDRGL